jgi:hypothetical protein
MSYYGNHSNSPVRPNLIGHPYVAPQNQCDGCRAGIPADSRGFHRMAPPGAKYPDYMSCTKERYEEEEE